MGTTWSEMDRTTRRRIRRLVRIGRLPEDPIERVAAKELALAQKGALWWRYFWVWFVPAVLLSMAAASRIHPLVVGMTMAVAAQSLFTRRNVNRLAATAGA